MMTLLIALVVGSGVAFVAQRGIGHRLVFAGIAVIACVTISLLIPSIPTHEQLERTDWSSRVGGRARAELLHTFGYDIAHVLLGTAIGGVVGSVVYRRP
jgi:hypothetical protein